jgi:hypothetical protein
VLPKITVVEQVLCYCSALAALLQSILGLVNQLYFLRITPCPKEYFRFTGKMEGYLARGVALPGRSERKFDLAEDHTR